MDRDTPTNPAARVLELAGVMAERLVADAEAEATSLVTAARAEADAILESSHADARQLAADLARSRKEHAAELERERLSTLGELSDTKADLEAEVVALRTTESAHRQRLRLLLTEQLAGLDTALPAPPAQSTG